MNSTSADLTARISNLTEAQRVQLLAQLRSTPTAAPTLTDTQLGIWLDEQIQPGTAAYNNVAAIELTNDVDAGALRDAFSWLAHRHPALRTCFPDDDGDASVHIAETPAAAFEVVDCSGLGRDAALAQARLLAATPLDVETGPLWHAQLISYAADRSILVLVLHHLISDGWSLNILMRELHAAYGAYRAGERLDQPAAAGQTAPPAAILPAAAREAWIERVGRDAGTLDFGDSSGGAGSRHAVYEVPNVTLAEAATAAMSTGALPFCAVLAAAACSLADETGQRRFVLSTPIDGRDDPRTHGVVGCFIRTVLLPIDLTRVSNAHEAIPVVLRALLDGIAHLDVAPADVARHVSRVRGGPAGALEAAMVTQNNAPVADPSLPGTVASWLPLLPSHDRTHLSFAMASGRDHGVLELHHAHRHVAPHTADRLAAGLVAHLDTLRTTP